MKILLVLGSLILPLLMLWIEKYVRPLRTVYHLLAIITALVFGNIVSFKIHEIISKERVFTTDIHALLLNPFLLLSGAYLGIFGLYCLWKWTMKNWL